MRIEHELVTGGRAHVPISTILWWLRESTMRKMSAPIIPEEMPGPFTSDGSRLLLARFEHFCGPYHIQSRDSILDIGERCFEAVDRGKENSLALL